MTQAIEAGAKVLDKGGTSLDAIEAAIRLLEDNPLFNCGRGAVFTADGKNEMDAAIMDGATLKAGAVAGVMRTRHPISAARAVMEKRSGYCSPALVRTISPRVGLQMEPPSYFFTERRWQSLLRYLKENNLPIPPRPAGAPPAPTRPLAFFETPNAHKYGTVGVVALDKYGNIAAGTSTGGLAGKRWAASAIRPR